LRERLDELLTKGQIVPIYEPRNATLDQKLKNEHWEVWGELATHDVAVGHREGGVPVCQITATNGVGVLTEETARMASIRAVAIAALPELLAAVDELLAEDEATNRAAYERNEGYIDTGGMVLLRDAFQKATKGNLSRQYEDDRPFDNTRAGAYASAASKEMLKALIALQRNGYLREYSGDDDEAKAMKAFARATIVAATPPGPGETRLVNDGRASPMADAADRRIADASMGGLMDGLEMVRRNVADAVRLDARLNEQELAPDGDKYNDVIDAIFLAHAKMDAIVAAACFVEKVRASGPPELAAEAALIEARLGARVETGFKSSLRAQSASQDDSPSP
jgi:hypothetical protein